MEAVGTLAGGIAHDFNNMLTGIMGFLELAIMKSRGRDVERDLRHVQASCETMAELIHRLLAFSSHQGFTNEIVSLRAVLTELEVILSHTIPKDISIRIELPEEDIVVRGNGSQIHQVFLNLCINAAQAMPEGGNLNVKVERLTADKNYLLTHDSLTEGEYYVTQVSDTGIGISKRTLERIFEPFFTTKNLSSKKGTGLGLAVTWQIVKEHGGHIDVYSELGEGSTFRVFLPISTESVTGTKESEPIELPGGDETILLVDDEAIVLAVASELLEQLGYTVRRAEDGISAEEIYRDSHHEIDLVILDLSMPRMGGRECLKRLRRINPNVPAIFSSGHNMEAARESLLAEGAQEVIQKPYRMEELARKIRAVVQTLPA
jgi:CheY-like chemotaxis protein